MHSLRFYPFNDHKTPIDVAKEPIPDTDIFKPLYIVSSKIVCCILQSFLRFDVLYFGVASGFQHSL